MMNIIVMSGRLERLTNASIKIALELAKQLNKLDNRCIVSGISINDDTINEKGVIKENNLELHYYHPSCDYNDKEKLYELYIAELKKLIEIYKIDAIICVQMPFGPMRAVVLSDKICCSKYLYQVDPWGLHEQEDFFIKTKEQRILQEQKVFEKVSHIFTTDILKEAYSQHSEYSIFDNKITDLEFPTIKEIDDSNSSVFEFDPNYINILYTGVMSDAYRSAEYFLSMLNNNDYRYNDEKQIRVYFLGKNESRTILHYATLAPDNIIIRSQVTVGEAFATMLKADVLLCIGNVFTNQVPSKLFDYFNTGKPIIFMKKIERCPCIKYVEKYPLMLVIDEMNEPKIHMLYDFISKIMGKRVEYKKIEEIFYKSTPNYVANIVNEIVHKTCK